MNIYCEEPPYRILLVGGKYYPQMYTSQWNTFRTSTDDEVEPLALIECETEEQARERVKSRIQGRIKWLNSWNDERGGISPQLQYAESWLKNVDTIPVHYADVEG